MKKYITLTILTLASALFVGCATSGDKPSIAGETPYGGYTGAKPYYVVKKNALGIGVLYAHDGEKWWYLKSPYIPAGYYKGAPVGIAENWAVVGGSHVRKHQRAPLPFRNQTVQPVFSEY